MVKTQGSHLHTLPTILLSLLNSIRSSRLLSFVGINQSTFHFDTGSSDIQFGALTPAFLLTILSALFSQIGSFAVFLLLLGGSFARFCALYKVVWSTMSILLLQLPFYNLRIIVPNVVYWFSLACCMILQTILSCCLLVWRNQLHEFLFDLERLFHSSCVAHLDSNKEEKDLCFVVGKNCRGMKLFGPVKVP